MRMRRATLIVLPFALAVFGAGCGGDSTLPDRTDVVAGIELYPAPSPIRGACRRAQAHSRVPILCPTVLPRPERSAAEAYRPGTPTAPLTTYQIRASRRGSVLGLGFEYNAETPNDLPRDRPERFLHFVVQGQGERLMGPRPRTARPAVLGGKRGSLAPATSARYGGSYFGNHVRLFWREGGVAYAATLHGFGGGTTALLGALIATLRPAETVGEAQASESADGGTTIAISARGPLDLALGRLGMWVATQGGRVVRLNGESGRVVGKPLRVPRELSIAVAVGHGLWVTREFPKPGLLRVDQESGRALSSVPVAPGPTDVASGRGALWVTSYGNSAERSFYRGGTLTRINPRANRVVATPSVGGGPVGVAAGAGGVWVANNLDDTVSRIDPDADEVVATTSVGAAPVEIEVSPDAVWVTNSLDRSVSRLEP